MMRILKKNDDATRPTVAVPYWSSSVRVVLALSIALLCGSALAQDTAPQDPREQARAIAADATQHYNMGRFDRALERYQEAYEVFAAPQLLFNLGQCFRELGNHERAVFYFERFLEQMPDAPNVETVRGLIVDVRAEMEREAAREEERRRAEEERERLRLQHERELREAELRARSAERDRERDLDSSLGGERRDDEGVAQKWWFWTILAGVVVAGAGVGLGVGLSNRDTVLPSGSLGTVDAR